MPASPGTTQLPHGGIPRCKFSLGSTFGGFSLDDTLNQ